ncbi:pseudouridine synthase [Campylobacter canadensis]|uniref:RNA pseudouridylate synthase n=1 Tax=Campylobacter canadensis TaxID=449520 RepID=A0ABS7WQZ1_9BACT|nr:pseudouridine synthase [Campylobacter canadensis]MBZ7987176.1 rRNA pseudouridine synthase [Campylobacter canadensis]MBZ7994472.1 rRNA pseudouridine synthase [Campylobacter canadensis]MBZ7996441.1 rRNA pseudouridine synthase [Campylobacter canadensis]MBZ7998200.1 rRNA pseudouridine synthase [Campylobacter canadensis]MBZ7999813.1 rRNA pseudouridine synthase [Campylobacter canadensis]
MRLNKFISHNSDYSRRKADELIANGLVKVNQKIIKDDFYEVKEDEDKVFVKNKRIYKRKDFEALIYHKDKGQLVSHTDDRDRKTIFNFLPSAFKNYNFVGRLDYASTGLLILVNSPVIADFLAQSSLEREYYLKLKGQISKEVILAMQNGLEITNSTKGAHEKSKITNMKISAFLDYEIFGSSGGYTKLRVLINEGKNRELRRFFAHFGLEVTDLKRVAFGRLELGNLKVNKYRFFTSSEYEDLRAFLKENKVYY